MALGLPLAEGLQLDLPPLPIYSTVCKLAAGGREQGEVSCERPRHFLLGQQPSKDKEKHSRAKVPRDSRGHPSATHRLVTSSNLALSAPPHRAERRPLP